MNPKVGATPARTIGAHSGGNRGIRCAGEAADIDRGDIGFADAVANGRSVVTSSAGGNSDPSNRGKTCDSEQRLSPDGHIQRTPSRDESNPLCIHEFSVVKSIGPYTWRMKCELCDGLFDLMIVRALQETTTAQQEKS